MFKVRNTPCSFNETEYEEDKDSFGCQGSINVYHCLLDERNRSGEICIQSVWVQPNYCPEYNTGANTLDTVPCNKSNGSCPGVLFRSNEVYKYSVCLNKTFTADKRVFGKNILPELWVLVGAGVLFLISVLLIVGCVVYQIRRKKNHRKINDDEEGFPLLSLIDSKEPFHKSAAFHEGVNFIKNDGKLVCLIGQWGSGKTATAKQVFKAVTNTPPMIIKDPLTFDVGEKPVIFDDAISRDITDIEMHQLKKKIEKLYENMSRSETKAFIIITLNEDMEHCYDFVKSLTSSEEHIKFINLSKTLTKGDRTQILHSHFQLYNGDKDFSKVEGLALTGKNSSLGYPEICALLSRCIAFQKDGPVVFSKLPLLYLKIQLEKMHFYDNEKFLMLVYMSLNEMEIDINAPNDNLFEILKSCGCGTKKNEKVTTKTECIETKTTGADSDDNTCSTTTIKKKDKDFITTLLSKEFVVREEETSIYRLQHDVIKRMTLIVFGTYHFDKLLAFTKLEELKGWIEKGKILSNPFASLDDIKPVLVIKKEEWKNYKKTLSIMSK